MSISFILILIILLGFVLWYTLLVQPQAAAAASSTSSPPSQTLSLVSKPIARTWIRPATKHLLVFNIGERLFNAMIAFRQLLAIAKQANLHFVEPLVHDATLGHTSLEMARPASFYFDSNAIQRYLPTYTSIHDFMQISNTTIFNSTTVVVKVDVLVFLINHRKEGKRKRTTWERKQWKLTATLDGPMYVYGSIAARQITKARLWNLTWPYEVDRYLAGLYDELQVGSIAIFNYWKASFTQPSDIPGDPKIDPLAIPLSKVGLTLSYLKIELPFAQHMHDEAKRLLPMPYLALQYRAGIYLVIKDGLTGMEQEVNVTVQKCTELQQKFQLQHVFLSSDLDNMPEEPYTVRRRMGWSRIKLGFFDEKLRKLLTHLRTQFQSLQPIVYSVPQKLTFDRIGVSTIVDNIACAEANVFLSNSLGNFANNIHKMRKASNRSHADYFCVLDKCWNGEPIARELHYLQCGTTKCPKKS